MQIEYKKLEELKPYENNPRQNDQAIDAVAKSIKEFGFKVPIIIDKNGIIVAGHTRYKSAIKLNLETVPVIVADDLTPKQIKAFRLADNKVSELAEWDFELLNAELNDLITDFNMTDFGFELPQIDNDIEVVEDEVEFEVPTRTKLGELYKLGRHRLLVGDSTNENQVKRLMNGATADLIVTDPPYNVNVEGKTNKKLKIQNDNISHFEEFLTAAFKPMFNALKFGGGYYIFHASTTQREFENAINACGLQVRCQLIWNKKSMVIGWADYQYKHEPIFYGWKEGANHFFTDDRTQTTVLEDKALDFKKMKKDELVKILEEIYSDKVSTTVISGINHDPISEHPTIKPLKLLARLIKNSSKQSELVLDLFGGSGSTICCCEQLNRTCYSMEIDPKYADVILNRWEKLTGQKAELIKEN